MPILDRLPDGDAAFVRRLCNEEIRAGEWICLWARWLQMAIVARLEQIWKRVTGWKRGRL